MAADAAAGRREARHSWRRARGARWRVRADVQVQEEGERPFFYFINIATSGYYLSARGKGGGLAIWTRK